MIAIANYAHILQLRHAVMGSCSLEISLGLVLAVEVAADGVTDEHQSSSSNQTEDDDGLVGNAGRTGVGHFVNLLGREGSVCDGRDDCAGAS